MTTDINRNRYESSWDTTSYDIEECYHNRCTNRKMNNNDTDADTVVHGSSN